MSHILITGGTGYIGSHTCLVLLLSDFEITIIDSNYNSSSNVINSLINLGKILKKNFINKIHFVKGDIRDETLLNNIFTKSQKNLNPIKAVIHFAGFKAVGESFKEPIKYWENNLLGSISLFKIMDLYECRNIVFSSSATVYSPLNSFPVSEDGVISPKNPYGNNKLAIETLLNDLSNSDERWKVISLRYFNPVGAHFSGNIGEDPIGLPNNLFPYICKVASGKLDKLNVFGNNWPTKDGTCLRDYIHVMDLSEAHKAALELLFKMKEKFLTLNIGNGIGTSVLEVISSFERVNHCKVPFSIVEKREGDIPILIADNKRALKLLEWKPKRDINQMCRDAWNWQKKNPSGYGKI